MIGITIELLLSWTLLYVLYRKDLSVLGLSLAKRKYLILLTGFFLPVFYLSALYLSIAVMVGNPFTINPDYTWGKFAEGLGFVMRGVWYEELLFRGALLYIIIKKWNSQTGLWISAITFGIYHWFSYGIIGQPFHMLTVFISTGTMGMLFAFAFYKFRTIWLPVVLHFGYNFTGMVLFSMEKNVGAQLFIKRFTVDPIHPEGIIPLLLLVLYYTGFPLLCFVFLYKLKPEPDPELKQNQ